MSAGFRIVGRVYRLSGTLDVRAQTLVLGIVPEQEPTEPSKERVIFANAVNFFGEGVESLHESRAEHLRFRLHGVKTRVAAGELVRAIANRANAHLLEGRYDAYCDLYDSWIQVIGED